MPITQKFTTDHNIEFDDFIEYAEHRVDVSKTDGLLELAEKFAMLGNNRTFLSDFFVHFIQGAVNRDPLGTLFSQSIVLARRKNFYIRANFWLPAHEMTENESILYAYHQAHDHNFDLLSLAYCGDGYVTDGYLYDYNKVAGYIGERVELLPLGSHKHEGGDVLLYECNKDIHFQRPPIDPSITLNLIPLVNQNGLRDQYFFEIDTIDSVTGKLAYYANNIIERRRNLFDIAKHVANEEIAQLFIRIASTHVCNRTRYEAMRALKSCNKDQHDALVYALRDDRTPIIRHYIDSIFNGPQSE